jgi:CRISPR-associated Csx2 family protein
MSNLTKKVFISFLGTNDYQSVKYQGGEGGEVVETRFVQEATLHFHCQGWTEQDKVLVLLTKDAREKNWEDHTFTDQKTNEPLPRTGLAKVLAELKLPTKIEPVDIPDGKSEAEIWEVFRAVYEAIPEGAHVVFDITHSFRSGPMLTMVLINYSKFLKGIQVKGIYYGAFEAKQDERVPLWNLTAFSQLQDWTSAANEFINFGSAKRLKELTDNWAMPEIKNRSSRSDQAQQAKQLSEQLSAMTQALATNRGQYIAQSGVFEKITNSLAQLGQSKFIVPYKYLFEKIGQKVSPFAIDPELKFMPAVQFCLDHDLIQQGITQLYEGIVSLILAKMGLEWKPRNNQSNQKEIKQQRELLSSALGYLVANEERKRDWKVPVDRAAQFEAFCQNQLASDFAPVYQQMATYRNDINHGGYTDNTLPKKFIDALKSAFGKTQEIMQGHLIHWT